MLTVLVVLRVVAECLQMRERVVQNRRKSARLLNVLEAIQAPLRTIEAAEEGSKVVHEGTLARIQSAVTEAKTLLEGQTVVSSYVSKLFASRSVERQFEDVRRNILAHTQALTLSVTVMGRMASNELLQMALEAKESTAAAASKTVDSDGSHVTDEDADSERKATLSAFVEATSCDEHEAIEILLHFQWDLDEALDAYLDGRWQTAKKDDDVEVSETLCAAKIMASEAVESGRLPKRINKQLAVQHLGRAAFKLAKGDVRGSSAAVGSAGRRIKFYLSYLGLGSKR